MKYGFIFFSDVFLFQEFDFMFFNFFYGKSWKIDLECLGGKGDIKDLWFVIWYGDEVDYKMIICFLDGQLMFLVNKLVKMKYNICLGSCIVEVYNGLFFFIGDVGQGESNICCWIIENDWLEIIIVLLENIFYNIGIVIYIWLLSNCKNEECWGKVQFIDGMEWYVFLCCNFGKKNCEFFEEQI